MILDAPADVLKMLFS